MATTYQYTTRSLTLSASTSIFIALPYVGASNSTTTEAGYNRVVRTAGTMSNMYLRVNTNTLTSTTTFVSRKNSADGNCTFTVASSATGEFEDTTNSDSISAGDTYGIKGSVGAGGTSMALFIYGFAFNATTDTVITHFAGNITYSTASTTFYHRSFGNPVIPTTESASEQFKMKTSATRKNFNVYILTNTRSTDTVFRSRLNGADGNLVITVASSATGSFEDTSNSDTLVSEDLMNNSVTTGTGTGSIIPTVTCTDLISTDGTAQFAIYSNSNTQAQALTRYEGVSGRITGSTTETPTQAKVGGSVTTSQYEAYFSANTVSATSNLRLRVNGANGNGNVVITASTTGWFEDTSNSDVLVSTDLYNWTLVTGAGGTSITNQMYGLKLQYSVPTTSDNLFFLTF